MCDNWVVLKIKPEDSLSEPFYKLLRGWSGGYTTSDSWGMNSGIVKVVDTEGGYVFHGFSGSAHTVRKGSYGIRQNIADVISYYQEIYPNLIEVVPDCDWNLFDFGETDES